MVCDAKSWGKTEKEYKGHKAANKVEELNKNSKRQILCQRWFTIQKVIDRWMNHWNIASSHTTYFKTEND